MGKSQLSIAKRRASHRPYVFTTRFDGIGMALSDYGRLIGDYIYGGMIIIVRVFPDD